MKEPGIGWMVCSLRRDGRVWGGEGRRSMARAKEGTDKQGEWVVTL